MPLRKNGWTIEKRIKIQVSSFSIQQALGEAVCYKAKGKLRWKIRNGYEFLHILNEQFQSFHVHPSLPHTYIPKA